MKRRALLALLAAALLGGGLGSALPQPRAGQAVESHRAAQLTRDDEAFLEDLSHRTFLFFWEQADLRTGLVRDRALVDGVTDTHGDRNVASIAATGFGLTAICIGADRGWVPAEDARRRVLTTLRFLATLATTEHGWFYHFLDSTTGERHWQSEVSSIDTALLLAGVLTARQYFRDDPEIVRYARLIYERVDFSWMLNGDPFLLSHGWKPETGFLAARWDSYSEHCILYLLAIGSPTHPISREAWYAWRRPAIHYAGYTYITGGPLFIHQYSHAWVDFRGRREERAPHTNYFENSVTATLAHRAFCVDLGRRFRSYSKDVWGITASDSEKGYVAWGGPPASPAIDGTLVPSAPAGSLMFTPDICIAALRQMRELYGTRVYGRYGFANAFNPLDRWVDPDVIGIDTGVTLLSAENLRTGNVWGWFMRNESAQLALDRVGLR